MLALRSISRPTGMVARTAERTSGTGWPLRVSRPFGVALRDHLVVLGEGPGVRTGRHAERLDLVPQLGGDRVEPVGDPVFDGAHDGAVSAVVGAVALVVQSEGLGDEPRHAAGELQQVIDARARDDPVGLAQIGQDVRARHVSEDDRRPAPLEPPRDARQGIDARPWPARDHE